MLLGREYLEIKGSSNTFDWAARNGHNETLMLLKREFPKIKGTSDVFGWQLKMVIMRHLC